MSQSDFGTINPTTKSGSTLATDLNDFRDAVHSTHKGSAAPSYARAGLYWLDDSGDPIWVKKVYDGANWIAVEVIDATNNVSYPFGLNPKLAYPVAGGTANALTLTLALAMSAYVDGDVLTLEAASNNTGSATLNASGVGAKAIRKVSGGADVAVAAGDMLAGRRYVFSYDAAANGAAGAWILTNPSRIAPADLGSGAADAAKYLRGDGSWQAARLQKFFESAEQTITSGGLLSVAHGLGEAPKLVAVFLICKTAEQGYSVGDIITSTALGSPETTSNFGVAVEISSSTDIAVRFGSATGAFLAPRKDNGGTVTLTNANWKLILRAWA